nr:MAG TPA: hypothetical protein [Caudoviricetes sp.]
MFYIGENLTLLCFNGLRSKNQKTKKINDGGKHAPLTLGIEVQPLKSTEI